MLTAMHERTTATDYALLILRISGLFLAIMHGWGKIYALSTGAEGFIDGVARMGFPFPVVFAWAAALSEFLGGLLVAAGLFTRGAAFFAACTMATAAFVRHRAVMHLLAWVGLASPGEEALRQAGDPERALLFLLIMVALIILGGGRLSLEHRLAHRRR